MSNWLTFHRDYAKSRVMTKVENLINGLNCGKASFEEKTNLIRYYVNIFYIYIYKHIYIHVYMHTYTQKQNLKKG